MMLCAVLYPFMLIMKDRKKPPCSLVAVVDFNITLITPTLTLNCCMNAQQSTTIPKESDLGRFCHPRIDVIKLLFQVL